MLMGVVSGVVEAGIWLLPSGMRRRGSFVKTPYPVHFYGTLLGSALWCGVAAREVGMPLL